MTAACVELEDGEIIDNCAHQQAAREGKAAKKKEKKANRLRQGTLSTGVNGAFVNIYGPNGFPSLDITRKEAIRLVDVQALLLWILGDGHSPQWVFVKNKPLISKVVLLALPGLDLDTFEEKKALMPNLARLGTPIPTLATAAHVGPGQAISQLFHAPLSRKRKREAGAPANGSGSPLGEQQRAKVGSKKRSGLPSAEQYRLSLSDMEANNYPMPLALPGDVARPEGFVATQPVERGCGEDGSEAKEMRLIAMDCEMCKTASGDALTRVSLVDAQGEVLMDELVVPEEPITDYVTEFSGITAAKLEGVTTRLHEVQARFCQIVDGNTILVGHGLENDLHAMRVVHAHIIDTSILFPPPRGAPWRSKLRTLASKFLKRTIQNGSHDSVDDARAAMDLVKLKLRKGPMFGTGDRAESGEKVLDILAREGKRVSLVDRQDILPRLVAGTANALVCADDEEVAAKVGKEAGKAGVDLVWGQLRALSQLHFLQRDCESDALGLTREPSTRQRLPTSFGRPSPAKDGGQAPAPPATSPAGQGSPRPAGGGGLAEEGGGKLACGRAAEEDALRCLDAAVGRVWEAMPGNSLLLLVTLAGNVPLMRLRREARYKRQQRLLGQPWTSQDEDAHHSFETRHLTGLTLLAVKRA